MFGRKKKNRKEPEQEVTSPPGSDLVVSDDDELLRLALSRLSLAAMGRDSLIDQSLDRLRGMARGELDSREIQRQIDRVSERIRVLDETESTNEHGGHEDSTQFDTFVNVLIESPIWNLEQKQELRTVYSDYEAGAVSAREVEDAILGTLKNTIFLQETEEEDSSTDVESLKDWIQEFLDSINAVDSGDDFVLQSLNEVEEQEALHEQWLTLSDQIIQRLSVLRRQRDDLELFLARLGKRLNEVEQQLSHIDENNADVHLGTQALKTDIEDQARGLSGSIKHLEDVDELKATIQLKMDYILERVDLFSKEEEQIQDSMRENIETLQTRLAELEQEKESLRALLQQEQTEAMTDALTGIANRHAFDKRIKEIFRGWTLGVSSGSVLMIDIDFFKKINDNYGHLAGDKALQNVARLLRSKIRAHDFLARYGGEEFVLVLSDAKPSTAYTVSEKLREYIERAPINYQGNPVPLTISIGVTGYLEQDHDWKEVFERADKALYRAKQMGRNRCELE